MKIIQLLGSKYRTNSVLSRWRSGSWVATWYQAMQDLSGKSSKSSLEIPSGDKETSSPAKNWQQQIRDPSWSILKLTLQSWPFKHLWKLSSRVTGQSTASVFSGFQPMHLFHQVCRDFCTKLLQLGNTFLHHLRFLAIFFRYKISGFWLVKWAFDDFWSSSEFPTGKSLDLAIKEFTRFDCFGLVEHMQIPQKWKDTTMICSLKAYIHLLGSNHPRNITAPWGQ